MFSQYIQSSINGGPLHRMAGDGGRGQSRTLSLHPSIHISSVWKEGWVLFTTDNGGEFKQLKQIFNGVV